ncbi:MAG: hypothetical protein AAF208_06760 [Cyanobacteria bacterium P01_A01_bin.45]
MNEELQQLTDIVNHYKSKQQILKVLEENIHPSTYFLVLNSLNVPMEIEVEGEIEVVEVEQVLPASL